MRFPRSLLLILVFLASSCVETIVLDPHEDLPIAVYCVLQEEGVQTLEIFYAKGKEQESFRSVTEAEARLYQGENPVATFHREGTSWKADYRPECGKSYRLEISLPGREPITAETRMPDDLMIGCYSRRLYEDEKLYYLAYSYELRVNTASIFHPTAYGEPYNQAVKMYVFPEDEYNDNVLGRFITSDHPGTDRFNVSPYGLRDMPCFQRDSLRKVPDYLRFRMAWYPIWYPDLPMHERFVRIDHPENFDNGLTDKDRSTSPRYSKRSFVLCRNFFYQYDKIIVIPFQQDLKLPKEPGQEKYRFYFVSDELDAFLKDLYTIDFSQDILSSVYRTKNPYTNISGGAGVFGAISVRKNNDFMIGYDDRIEDWE